MRKTLQLVKESLEVLIAKHEVLRDVRMECGYWSGLSLKACWWLQEQVLANPQFADENEVIFVDPSLAYFSIMAKSMGLLKLDIQVRFDQADEFVPVDFAHFDPHWREGMERSAMVTRGQQVFLAIERTVRPAPKLSLIVGHRNRPHFLVDLLESCQKQSSSHFEVVVVDDGSDPKHQRELLNLTHRKWKFPLRLVRQAQRGAREVRNAGASAASHEVLVFIDDDNVLLPDAVEVYRHCWQCSQFEIFVSPFIRVLERKYLRSVKKVQAGARIWCPLGGGGDLGVLENVLGDMNLMMGRRDYHRLGGLSNLTQLSCEDWQFLLHAQDQGLSIGVIPRPLQVYSDQPNSFFKRAPRILSELSAVAPVLQDLDSLDRQSQIGFPSIPTLTTVEIAKYKMRKYYDQFRLVPAPGKILFKGSVNQDSGYRMQFEIEKKETWSHFSMRFESGTIGELQIEQAFFDSRPKTQKKQAIQRRSNLVELEVAPGTQQIEIQFPAELIYVHWACFHGMRSLQTFTNY